MSSMKALIVLILVQTGVLLLMFGKIVAIEEEMAPAMLDEKNTLLSDKFANTQSQSYSNDTYLYPNEDQLRQIIREELAAQLDSSFGPAEQMDAVFAPNSTEKAEDQYQREQVAQQLDYHTSVGRISDTDMQKLQMDIAKLDEAGRKEMLSELTRTLNSGQLKGRL
jgi:hypothetical protein